MGKTEKYEVDLGPVLDCQMDDLDHNVLYRQVILREAQAKYDVCIEYGEPWSKNVHDAYRTSHWDALLAVRDRINELTKADWRLSRPACSDSGPCGHASHARGNGSTDHSAEKDFQP
jgi:hypothetical protein